MKLISTERHRALQIIKLPDAQDGVLDRSDLLDLAEVLEAANTDNRVGVVVLLGRPGHFCLGLDLAQFSDPETFDELAAALRRCFRALALLQPMLVVAVDGPTVGFGLTLLSHADVVVASERATFRAPFVDLGLVPEAGSTLSLTERIGHLAAIRLLCLGEEVTAEDALRIGLITNVIHDGDVTERALAIASKLSRCPSGALSSTRALIGFDRSALLDRIDIEIEASRCQLDDPATRKRIARFAGHFRRANHPTFPSITNG